MIENLAAKTGGADEAMAVCRHCGTAYRVVAEAEDQADPHSGGEGFCCAGCEYVWRLIHQEGLEDFYSLKGGQVSAPVRTRAFERAETAWLEEAVRLAEEAVEAEEARGAPVARLRADVQGVSCLGCVWLVEHVFRECPGALRADVDAVAGQVELRWTPGAFDAAAFAERLNRFGYPLGPAGEGKGKQGRAMGELATRIGICGALALNAMAFSLPRYLGAEEDFALSRIFDLVALLSATLALLAGGGLFFQRALAGLRRGVLHVDLPISLGLLGAYGGSLAGWLKSEPSLLYFDFVAVFAFLMLVGRWAQEKALLHNRARLLEAGGGALRVEAVTAEGVATGERRLAETLSQGDGFGVAAGGLVPVNATLREDAAEFSLESISGEPDAVLYRRGEEVPSGALYLGGQGAQMEAREDYGDSVLAQLLGGGRDLGWRDRRVERFLAGYLVAVLVIAMGGALAWGFGLGEWIRAGQVAISVLVVSCPCALGVALPLVDDFAVDALRRVGLFVRRRRVWSRLRGLRKVVFDKTGTLTLENPRLVNGEALDELDEAGRLALGRLVRDSRHPAGRALREAMGARGWNLGPRGEGTIEEKVGSGVWSGGETEPVWSLGKPGWLPPQVASHPPAVEGTRPQDEPDTLVLSRDGQRMAGFRLREEAREGAARELAALRARDLSIWVLSGDRPERVQRVAADLGVPAEHVLGGFSPEQKAGWVEQEGGREILYLGDGANDSLAFDAAGVCGAMAAGQGPLESKADFYYLGRGLRAVGALLALARRRARTVRGVVAFAITYNTFAIALCLAGKMNPLLAAVLMPLSSLITIGLARAGMRPRRSPV